MSETKKKTGFWKEIVLNNPVFGLYLGCCSTLGITTAIDNAIGMGMAVIIILIMSNIAVSLIAKITPDEIHIPVYIVLIATLVTIVELLMQAYMPTMYSTLGAFVDLIVVNCIILGRAEAYACSHNVAESARDGFMMGFAYTMALLAMSVIRQIFGTGVLSLSNPFTAQQIFSVRLIPEGYEIAFLTSQTGAFLCFACLAAAVTAYKNSVADAQAAAEKAAKLEAAKKAAEAKKAAAAAATAKEAA